MSGERVYSVQSGTSRMRRRVFAAVAFGAALATAGCAYPTDHDARACLPANRPLVTATDYRVAPPDVLAVSSRLVWEANEQVRQIRPDGAITLPLLGDVYVAGLTGDQITHELTERARRYYYDAEVSVRVAEFNSQKIFVFGEVAHSGALPWHGANRVLDTLALAQPTPLADPSRVIVLRANDEGELIRRKTIDLDTMAHRGGTPPDAALEEGDVLYVPPNPLGKIGLAFQQLLRPIRPDAQAVQGG